MCDCDCETSNADFYAGIEISNQADLEKCLPILLKKEAKKRFIVISSLKSEIDLRAAYPDDWMHCGGCMSLIKEPLSFCVECRDEGVINEFDLNSLNNKCQHGNDNSYAEICPICGNIETFCFDFLREDQSAPLHGIDFVIIKNTEKINKYVWSVQEQCENSKIPCFFNELENENV